MTESERNPNTEYRVSILVEKWDHVGDAHSPKGWCHVETSRLTMCSKEESLQIVRQLHNTDLVDIE